MLANDPLYITPEDYLAAEEISPIRHEYRDGEVFAMTGGTLNHSAIVLNLATTLKIHLRGSGCRPFSEGTKTRVESSNAYYYPDVVVTCDDRDRPSKEQYVEYPRLIIEVLSPSTARFDRTEKFADYRTIPSLEEYVLVSTDRQQVEVFQKGDRGNWTLAATTDPIQLASVNCAISIAEIYEDTDIPATLLSDNA
ncbi:MAG: Uma2 family endonuclease [Cyanobacteria bacterium SID2]|nr:Uma2 family endonuclease [Cyanobacteria bacterium SID2]MBP0002857.1 Uma2 family endonuclease [Cyanobacteria bacterium SBC]